MVKNRTGVLTHPVGGEQDGHCHASSFVLFSVFGSLLHILQCLMLLVGDRKAVRPVKSPIPTIPEMEFWATRPDHE